MKKKLLAILLTLAMVVTMIPAIFVTVTAVEDLPDYTAVSTADALKTALNAATDSTKTYKIKLTQDITLPADWAMGKDLHNVTFDGQGHTITVASKVTDGAGTLDGRWPKYGIFTDRANGVWNIKNVNIVGSIEVDGYPNNTTQKIEMGVLVGVARGEVNLENVHADVDVSLKNQKYDAPVVGGFVGTIEGKTYSSFYAINSSYTGAITTDQTIADVTSIGAFAGAYNGSAKGYGFLDCSSKGANVNAVAFTDQIGPTGGWMALPSATAVSDYAGLKAMTGGNYYLTADITLTPEQQAEWAPLPSSKYILEGNGHKISGLNYTCATTDTYAKPSALFKETHTGTVVSRLTVEGSLTTSVKQTSMQMGGLIASAMGKTSIVDVVCDIDVTETLTSGGVVSGIIGSTYKATQVTFMGCVNNGDVTRTQSGRMGGLMAEFGVSPDYSDYTAYNPAGVNHYYLRFIDCVNNGAVNGNGDIGGIFGGYNGNTNVDTDGVDEDANAEGNQLKGDGDIKVADIRFVDCVNNGAVTSAAAAGGLWCYLNNYFDYVAINCVNNGTVTAKGAAGGICRDMQNGDSIIMQNCVNYGAVNCVGNAGGIIAYLSAASVAIDGCANYGTVTSKNGYISGVVGSFLDGAAATSTATVTNCCNYGEVYATATSNSEHGVAGIVNCLVEVIDITIDRCHNFGKLSTHVWGWTKAGGILATAQKSNGTANKMDVEITNCSNFGTFEIASYGNRGDNQYYPEIGGISGTCSGIAATSTFTVSNCYSNSVVVESETAKATRLAHTDDEPEEANKWKMGLTSISSISTGASGTKAVNNCVAVDPELVTGSVVSKFSGVSGTGNIEIIGSTKMNDVISTLGSAFVLDDGQIEPKYSFNNVSTQVYATQEATAGATDTVDVRVLALVNSLGYDLAGVRLYKADGTTKVADETTTTVYSGVIDGTETLYAPYGTYYLPITVKGINDEGTYTFVVETYVEKDEVETPSDKYTIVITDGKVVSAKKN